jgi:hypothetical protein
MGEGREGDYNEEYREEERMKKKKKRGITVLLIIGILVLGQKMENGKTSEIITHSNPKLGKRTYKISF